MKKLIAGVLTAMMICGSVTALAVDYGAEYQKLPTPQTVQKFSDVPNTHWAFDYIGEMAQRDVISGYPDGRFIPENQVTRAEFAKIMVCAAGLRVTNNNTTSFDDVYTSDWYCPYVECAKDYLTGYSTNIGTIYKPTTPALREDIAVALVKLKGYDISLADESILNMFTDSYSISSSARKYVAVAVERGIVSGYDDSTFRGQATITRAEAATLLWRAFQYGNDNKVVEPTETITETPKPVEQSQATEKPTATPKPTEKPQATPTPEPTEEPTPEPTEKPYKIDTLVKADVSANNIYHYTCNGDYLYYVEYSSGSIMKVNIKSKDKEKILSIGDLTIDTDEYTLRGFNIYSICYNKYKDTLLVQGQYMTVNSAERLNNKYLYEINDDGEVSLITDDFYDDSNCLIGVLSCGDYVTTNLIVDCENFDSKGHICYGELVEEVNDEIYYLTTFVIGNAWEHYTLCKYNYIELSDIWDKYLSASAFGLNDKGYAIVDRDNNDTIIFYNFKGKEMKRIIKSDCDVVDKTVLDYYNTNRRLLFFDDNIVFYDTNAKAFRMISENK